MFKGSSIRTENKDILASHKKIVNRSKRLVKFMFTECLFKDISFQLPYLLLVCCYYSSDYDVGNVA